MASVEVDRVGTLPSVEEQTSFNPTTGIQIEPEFCPLSVDDPFDTVSWEPVSYTHLRAHET